MAAHKNRIAVKQAEGILAWFRTKIKRRTLLPESCRVKPGLSFIGV